MFADNTLTPREAVRLCALGTLARKPMRYGELAGSVRHFISRVAGPQIDLMGTSIELLRHEGLVQAMDGMGQEDDATLTLTPAGSRELHHLLTARLRPGSDLSRLIVALKMRFLGLLEPQQQRAQIDLLAEAAEGELSRLDDLLASLDRECAEDATLGQWLDREISDLEGRLAWLEQFSTNL